MSPWHSSWYSSVRILVWCEVLWTKDKTHLLTNIDFRSYSLATYIQVIHAYHWWSLTTEQGCGTGRSLTDSRCRWQASCTRQWSLEQRLNNRVFRSLQQLSNIQFKGVSILLKKTQGFISHLLREVHWHSHDTNGIASQYELTGPA